MEEMRSVIVALVKEKKEILLEDQLLTKEYAEKANEASLQNFTKEARFEMLSRLAMEYETLNEMAKADKHYKELIKLSPNDHLSLFTYA